MEPAAEHVGKGQAAGANPSGPALSVIIPSFNYARFIRHAIDSVLSQDFDDFELIVVDDGSTDNSWDIISSYGDRLTKIRNKNQGAARACLGAARIAKGRYIAILDADDEFSPGCFKAIAAHFDANPAKIQFQLMPIDADGAQNGVPFPTFQDPYTREQMLEEVSRNGSYMTPPCSGIVYRADVLAAIEDIDYERYIDGVAYLLCPFMGDVVTLREPLGRYRYHGNNASGFDGPTPQWLAHEQQRFCARLDHLRQICTRLGIDTAGIPDGRSTAGVLEWRILEQVAQNEPVRARDIYRYIGRTWRTKSKPKFKMLMTAWALTTLCTTRSARRTMMQWRYNPHRRPKILRWLKANVRGA